MKSNESIFFEGSWVRPEGYQRTSKLIQKKYLEILLQEQVPTGDILDVGCGTGNSLIFIDLEKTNKYIGVDISSEMIKFSRSVYGKLKNVDFIKSDFLNNDLDFEHKFDHIICAACLHWFYPNHDKVIKKIKSYLKPNGLLHLSCAARFNLLDNENLIQEKVLKKVREQFDPISDISTFNSRRFSFKNLKELTDGFEVLSVSFYEKKIEFSSIEDFKDWHLGSGSVVSSQFKEDEKALAEELYYNLLYKEYTDCNYQVSYATHLLTLRS